jgi:hypothetical protein
MNTLLGHHDVCFGEPAFETNNNNHQYCEEILRRPIQGERGKAYHAIKCSDKHNCGDTLLLAEYSATFDESLDGDEVQCPFCKRVTTVERRRLHVHHIT